MLKSIIFLCSLSNTDDIFHRDALVSRFQDRYSNLNLIYIDASLSDKNLAFEYTRASLVNHHENVPVIVIGEKGLVALNALQNKLLVNHDTFVGASVHLHFEIITKLRLNFLAIPESTLSDKQKELLQHNISQITYTITVPSINKSVDVLKKYYNNWQFLNTKKQSLDSIYIIVTLPGDATDENMNINLFTKESASILYAEIIKLRKRFDDKHKIIVQNSSKTGKYNDKGDIICSHEYKTGEDPGIAIDGVSKYFISLLESSQTPYEFYNFAFEETSDGTKTKHSAYAPLLYLAQSNYNNFYIIPGESVSMVGTIPLYFMPEKVLVFKPDSLCDSHKAILKSVYKRGDLSTLELDSIKYLYDLYKMTIDDSILVSNSLVKSIDTFSNKKPEDEFVRKLSLLLFPELYSHDIPGLSIIDAPKPSDISLSII